ncbi:hypothetical protein [Alicyclobacillus sendaiensis]|uniref:hypothetical protein n=1 Tax=Alicyclobacillus sendaiensis TaxID=192387 RepID=UPI0026F4151A|nr:hypothetical protein [Alicyclobacillus sendaiensis]
MSKVMMFFRHKTQEQRRPEDAVVEAQIRAIWQAMASFDNMTACRFRETHEMMERMKQDIAHLAATVSALQRSLNTLAAELKGWEARR